jgi:hypothetical protein
MVGACSTICTKADGKGYSAILQDNGASYNNIINTTTVTTLLTELHPTLPCTAMIPLDPPTCSQKTERPRQEYVANAWFGLAKVTWHAFRVVP